MRQRKPQPQTPHDERERQAMLTVRRVLLSLTLLVVLAAAAPSGALAAAKQSGNDRALLVNQSFRYLVLPPGKSISVWFDFQNTGTSTWTNADPSPIALNTADPMNRTSKFEPMKVRRGSKRPVSAWRAHWRPTRLLQKTVKPGETGRFRFVLTAPKNPGIWAEQFAVVRGQKTTVPGGEAEFVIVVGTSGPPEAVYKAWTKEPTVSLWVKPGELMYRPLEFRNVGYATWRADGFSPTQLIHLESFQNQPTGGLRLESSVAVPQATKRAKSTTVVMKMVAPNELGVYQGRVTLYGPYGVIAGSTVNLSVTVSLDPKPPLDAEPALRVGVFSPAKDKTTGVSKATVGANGTFEIRRLADGSTVATQDATMKPVVAYDPAKQQYTLTYGANLTETSANGYRFVPVSSETVMEIKTTALQSYNRFRGTLEIRYAPATKKLWVINELPVESYLRGLAETSSVAPVEFAKTLITAARSYALYHAARATKHANEFYHINSTTDQVYKGYAYELKTPNITEAVGATRGVVVTHPSMVSEKNPIGFIVAAYSSCTDGRTRSYEERWGGTPGLFPYLVSVPDPNGICTDPTLLAGGNGNHMVGMSARGALRTIVNEGAAYDTMLKYYYTGVTVTRAYL